MTTLMMFSRNLRNIWAQYASLTLIYGASREDLILRKGSRDLNHTLFVAGQSYLRLFGIVGEHVLI